MNRKTAFVLLSGALLGPLCACMQPQATAPAAPPPPPATTQAPPPAAAAPAPVAEPTPGGRWVSIQGATCKRLLELSADDRAAASLFYVGYHAARFGSKTIDVAAIPVAEERAENYCTEHPDRPAVEAFRQAYRQTFTR